MKKTNKTPTRKAYFLNKNGSKDWFDIPKDTAKKVLSLQKWFQEKKELNTKNKPNS